MSEFCIISSNKRYSLSLLGGFYSQEKKCQLTACKVFYFSADKRIFNNANLPVPPVQHWRTEVNPCHLMINKMCRTQHKAIYQPGISIINDRNPNCLKKRKRIVAYIRIISHNETKVSPTELQVQLDPRIYLYLYPLPAVFCVGFILKQVILRNIGVTFSQPCKCDSL